MYVSMRWKMMDNKTPIMISKWWIIIQQKGMMLLWSSWGWWSTSFALNESYGVIWGHVQVVGLGWDLLHFLSKRPLVIGGAFTLDIKSMLNENLGGILGGTQCLNGR